MSSKYIVLFLAIGVGIGSVVSVVMGNILALPLCVSAGISIGMIFSGISNQSEEREDG